jgi:hypothetical protein
MSACGDLRSRLFAAHERIVTLYEQWDRPGDAASAELWRARRSAASPQSGG